MLTILSSIVGAIVGGAITWAINRKKPHYVTCEEVYRGYYDWRNLPEAKIFLRDTPVNALGILELKINNSGSLSVENPRITIRLNSDTQIVNVISKVSPERNSFREVETSSDGMKVQSHIDICHENSSVTLIVDYLIPYSTSSEEVVVEIFTDGKISDVEIFGNGIMRDGSGWAVNYQKSPESVKKYLRRLSKISRCAMWACVLLLLINLYLYIPKIYMASEVKAIFQFWLFDPWLWCFMVVFVFGIIMWTKYAWKGVGSTFYIPFTNKMFYFGIRRR